MSIPISSLDVATVINDNDLMLVRQNLVDKQAFASLMRTINIDALTELTSPASTDMMIISNGVSNFRIAYSNVSFPSGTIMWFYQTLAPAGWQIFDNTSGALLSVKGPGGAIPGQGSYSSPGTLQGEWQQLGTSLTVAQIPSHDHGVNSITDAGNSVTYVARGRFPSTGVLIMRTNATGGGEEHNHGDLWRPYSHVGILARKL